MNDAKKKPFLILMREISKTAASQEIALGDKPRLNYLEIARALNADFASSNDLIGPLLETTSLRKFFGHRKIVALAASIAGLLTCRQRKMIYATGEEIGFPLAAMLKFVRWQGRLVVVVHNCQGRSRQLLALIGHKPFYRLACVSRSQRDILINEMSFPAEKVVWLADTVDAEFFAPALEPAENKGQPYIFACGMENRDYDTLIAAMETVPIQLRILASGYMRADAQSVIERGHTLGERIKVLQRVSWNEMRRLYAGAQVVVVPLKPVSYAAGVNGLLEGMAMSKPVIVTKSPGITEYVEGSEIIVVPPHNPTAMAAALNKLLKDPKQCSDLGRQNRQRVIEKMSVDAYVKQVVRWATGK